MIGEGMLKWCVEKRGRCCMGKMHLVSCATSEAGLGFFSGREGIDHNSGSYREL